MNCWVCGSTFLFKVKNSNISTVVAPDDFRITDVNYGVTGNLYECSSCSFVQCTDFTNSNDFYESMTDNDYEVGREARKKEMRHILNFAERTVGSILNVLDIGAGSGIFVEVAGQSGYQAIGIEPSKSLVRIAEENNLEVKLGTLPSSKITGKFDLIALIDVIEHVNEPSKLIGSLEEYLNDQGSILISTPDVASKFARLMKWRWWHYRVAHIGYFSLHTLDLLMFNNGYRNVARSRPVWYFNADYILKRISLVLTKRNFTFRALHRFKVRLNLHDSILCIYKKM